MGVNLDLQPYGKNTDKTFKNKVLRIIFETNEKIMEIMGKLEVYTTHQIRSVYHSPNISGSSN
jgi:hypothetical protein